ncbi:hypothetical protein MY1884_007443 [Beauveria asiatica]
MFASTVAAFRPRVLHTCLFAHEHIQDSRPASSPKCNRLNLDAPLPSKTASRPETARGRRERREFRNTSTTYGTYLYHVSRPRRQNRPERACGCGCSSKQRREHSLAAMTAATGVVTWSLEETCRGRSPARSAADGGEENEEEEEEEEE